MIFFFFYQLDIFINSLCHYLQRSHLVLISQYQQICSYSLSNNIFTRSNHDSYTIRDIRSYSKSNISIE